MALRWNSLKSFPRFFLSKIPSAFKPKFQFIRSSNSIKREISLIYTIILALILIVFSGVMYVILSMTLYKKLDMEVQLKAREISDSLNTCSFNLTNSFTSDSPALTNSLKGLSSGCGPKTKSKSKEDRKSTRLNSSH